MVLHVCFCPEGLVALYTIEWLLVKMDPLMNLEVLKDPEAFVAVSAPEWLSPEMNVHVGLKAGVLPEDLVAILTSSWHLNTTTSPLGDNCCPTKNLSLILSFIFGLRAL